MKTDKSIIKWLADSISAGAEINSGDLVEGRIPESGLFYNGAQRGMIAFEHVVTEDDIKAVVRRFRAEVAATRLRQKRGYRFRK